MWKTFITKTYAGFTQKREQSDSTLFITPGKSTSFSHDRGNRAARFVSFAPPAVSLRLYFALTLNVLYSRQMLNTRSV